MNKFFGFLLVVVLVLLLFVPFFLYGAWATAFVSVHLWSWFVVPVFGVKALTMAQAFGLSLFVGYLTKQHFTNHSKDERDTKTRTAELVGIMIVPWAVLLVGYLCKTYWM